MKLFAIAAAFAVAPTLAFAFPRNGWLSHVVRNEANANCGEACETTTTVTPLSIVTPSAHLVTPAIKHESTSDNCTTSPQIEVVKVESTRTKKSKTKKAKTKSTKISADHLEKSSTKAKTRHSSSSDILDDITLTVTVQPSTAVGVLETSAGQAITGVRSNTASSGVMSLESVTIGPISVDRVSESVVSKTTSSSCSDSTSRGSTIPFVTSHHSHTTKSHHRKVSSKTAHAGSVSDQTLGTASEEFDSTVTIMATDGVSTNSDHVSVALSASTVLLSSGLKITPSVSSATSMPASGAPSHTSPIQSVSPPVVSADSSNVLSTVGPIETGASDSALSVVASETNLDGPTTKTIAPSITSLIATQATESATSSLLSDISLDLSTSASAAPTSIGSVSPSISTISAQASSLASSGIVILSSTSPSTEGGSDFSTLLSSSTTDVPTSGAATFLPSPKGSTASLSSAPETGTSAGTLTDSSLTNVIMSSVQLSPSSTVPETPSPTSETTASVSSVDSISTIETPVIASSNTPSNTDTLLASSEASTPGVLLSSLTSSPASTFAIPSSTAIDASPKGPATVTASSIISPVLTTSASSLTFPEQGASSSPNEIGSLFTSTASTSAASDSIVGISSTILVDSLSTVPASSIASGSSAVTSAEEGGIATLTEDLGTMTSAVASEASNDVSSAMALVDHATSAIMYEASAKISSLMAVATTITGDAGLATMASISMTDTITLDAGSMTSSIAAAASSAMSSVMAMESDIESGAEALTSSIASAAAYAMSNAMLTASYAGANPEPITSSIASEASAGISSAMAVESAAMAEAYSVFSIIGYQAHSAVSSVMAVASSMDSVLKTAIPTTKSSVSSITSIDGSLQSASSTTAASNLTSGFTKVASSVSTPGPSTNTTSLDISSILGELSAGLTSIAFSHNPTTSRATSTVNSAFPSGVTPIETRVSSGFPVTTSSKGSAVAGIPVSTSKASGTAISSGPGSGIIKSSPTVSTGIRPSNPAPSSGTMPTSLKPSVASTGVPIQSVNMPPGSATASITSPVLASTGFTALSKAPSSSDVLGSAGSSPVRSTGGTILITATSSIGVTGSARSPSAFSSGSQPKSVRVSSDRTPSSGRSSVASLGAASSGTTSLPFPTGNSVAVTAAPSAKTSSAIASTGAEPDTIKASSKTLFSIKTSPIGTSANSVSSHVSGLTGSSQATSTVIVASTGRSTSVASVDSSRGLSSVFGSAVSGVTNVASPSAPKVIFTRDVLPETALEASGTLPRTNSSSVRATEVASSKVTHTTTSSPLAVSSTNTLISPGHLMSTGTRSTNTTTTLNDGVAGTINSTRTSTVPTGPRRSATSTTTLLAFRPSVAHDPSAKITTTTYTGTTTGTVTVFTKTFTSTRASATFTTTMVVFHPSVHRDPAVSVTTTTYTGTTTGTVTVFTRTITSSASGLLSSLTPAVSSGSVRSDEIVSSAASAVRTPSKAVSSLWASIDAPTSSYAATSSNRLPAPTAYSTGYASESSAFISPYVTKNPSHNSRGSKPGPTGSYIPGITSPPTPKTTVTQTSILSTIVTIPCTEGKHCMWKTPSVSTSTWTTTQTSVMTAISCITFQPKYVTTTMTTSETTKCQTYTVPQSSSWVWPEANHTISVPPHWTTSTVWATSVIVETKCPSEVPKCPKASQYTQSVTSTIPVSTTRCHFTPTANTSSIAASGTTTSTLHLTTTKHITQTTTMTHNMIMSSQHLNSSISWNYSNTTVSTIAVTTHCSQSMTWTESRMTKTSVWYGPSIVMSTYTTVPRSGPTGSASCIESSQTAQSTPASVSSSIPAPTYSSVSVQTPVSTTQHTSTTPPQESWTMSKASESPWVSTTIVPTTQPNKPHMPSHSKGAAPTYVSAATTALVGSPVMYVVAMALLAASLIL